MATDLMNPVLCDICVKAAVKYHCNTCGDALCTTCKEYHLRSKGSRHHQIVPYAQKLNPKYLIGLSCHNHPNNAPEFWCETCGVPICVSCITDKHKGHQICNITTMLSEKRDKMVEEMKNLRDNTVVEWETVLKQAQEIIAGYLADIENVDKDLVARAKQMHKQVDDILSKSQKTLQEMKVVSLAKLQDQEKYLAEKLERLKQDVQNYEDKLQEADANVLLQFEESTMRSTDKPKPLARELVPLFTPGQDDIKSMECMFGNVIANHDIEDRTQESVMSSASGETAKDSNSGKTTVQSKQSSPGCGTLARSLIPKPTLQSEFDVETNNPYIACTEQGLAWVVTYQNFFSSKGIIRLVNREGSVKDTINTDFSINDMVVTSDGDLLIADFTNSCIKSVSRHKIRTLFRTGRKPSGLCCLHNGEIVVTLGEERKVPLRKVPIPIYRCHICALYVTYNFYRGVIGGGIGGYRYRGIIGE